MKTVLKILAWILGSVAALLVALQIILTSSLPAKLVDRYAPEFIDGDLGFSRVNVNLFKRFPNVCVSLKDATLTYPDGRFAALDSVYCDYRLLEAGKNIPEALDTLASFRNFEAQVNVLSLIRRKISVKTLELSHPRIFAKMYNDSTANWNIFKTSGEKDTTSSSGIPDIYVRRVVLDERPNIVFCMPQKELAAALMMKEMSLKGSVKTWDLEKARVRFAIDSLGVFGRLGRDTLLFGLDLLDVRARDREVTLKADARAYALTRTYGKIHIPMSINAEALFPEDSVLTVEVPTLEANVSGIPVAAEGMARFNPEGTYVNAVADIEECNLDYLLNHFAGYFVKQVENVKLESALAAHAECEGTFGDGSTPRIDGEIRKLCLKGSGIDLDVVGTVEDLLDEKALFDVKADLEADLDGVTDLILRDMGMEASGDLDAHLGGRIRKDQLSMDKFAKANLEGCVNGHQIDFAMPEDTLSAYVENLNIKLAATGNTYIDELSNKARMLALEIASDSLYADVNTTVFRGKDVNVKLQNSAGILLDKKKAAFYPLNGNISARRVTMRDADSTFIMVSRTDDAFSITPKRSNQSVPVLKLHSKDNLVMYRSRADRYSLKGVDIDLTAEMSSTEKKAKLKAMMDSLARVYPEVPRDSLVYKLRPKGSGMPGQMPDWLSEEDFRKKDIHISIDESIMKYYRDWAVSGSVVAESARITTPAFPLKTSVTDADLSFNNDMVEIENITVDAGESNLQLDGSASNLRKFIAGRGAVDVALNLNSTRLNLNELLAALSEGAESDMDESLNSDAVSDADYEDMVVMDSYEDADPNRLIVVPANVNAKVNIDAMDLDYAGFNLTTLGTRLLMKERCLQITNTVATSDIGNIFVEGFYSTRTKDDIKTGFALSLTDVTAEDVIELLPALDTIVPMLSSFSGMLNLDLAGTVELDTLMNLKMPTANGVIRLVGENMEIYDDEDFRRIAKLLLFRNKKSGYVDELAVEGYLADNKLEIFPFVLSLDRYRLALSGVQNLDTSFRYHASVLKSPIWFRFGIDLWGNFDKSRFKIGRPKYKNTNVPIFSTVIDTTRINLSESIHNIFEKGVEAAIAENEKQQAIKNFKESSGYVSAVDMPLDTLSGKEMHFIDSLSNAPEIDLDSIDESQASDLLATEDSILSE